MAKARLAESMAFIVIIPRDKSPDKRRGVRHLAWKSVLGGGQFRAPDDYVAAYAFVFSPSFGAIQIPNIAQWHLSHI
jgi:hypothetical protein